MQGGKKASLLGQEDAERGINLITMGDADGAISAFEAAVRDGAGVMTRVQHAQLLHAVGRLEHPSGGTFKRAMQYRGLAGGG